MKDPIVWTGDLDDDCTAHWHDLILRAENMGNHWWWTVIATATSPDKKYKIEFEVGSSLLGRRYFAYTGVEARKKAEHCAKKYIKTQKD